MARCGGISHDCRKGESAQRTGKLQMARHKIYMLGIIRNLLHIYSRGDLCIDGILFPWEEPTCTQSPAQTAGKALGSFRGVNKPASAAGKRLGSQDGGTEPQCAYGDGSPADSGVNPSWACSDFVFGRFLGFPCLPSFSTPKGEGSNPSALNASAKRG